MTFFNPTESLFRPKQEALDIQDALGSWKLEFKLGMNTLFSTIYTRIDQVFLVWGLLTLVMFTVGQLLPLSWSVLAVAWSVLTVLGTIGMASLTLFWARVESLVWLIHLWVALMLVGMAVTDYGIFCNSGVILMNLCPLWLGLSALGYGVTGVGLRSRAFLFVAVIHLCSIWFLPVVIGWQFLATGIVIGGSLLLLAQVQWDMRLPVDFEFLTEEQKAFNRQQQQQRQDGC